MRNFAKESHNYQPKVDNYDHIMAKGAFEIRVNWLIFKKASQLTARYTRNAC